MLSLQHKGLLSSASETSEWLYTIESVQKNAVQNTQSPSIRIIGGSGSLYSVSAYDLEQQLGTPVTNLGSHAGLGLKYLLYRAKKYLRPNDVALLLIEPNTILRTDCDWTVADWTIPYDYGYLYTLDLHELTELLSKLTPKEYLLRIASAFYDNTPARPRAVINQSGDLTSNLASKRSARTAALLAAFLTYKMQFEFAASNIQHLRDFIQWCREQHIVVIGGYSVIMENPAYYSPRGLQKLNAWKHLWEDLGVPVLENPRNFIFPFKLFFDTYHHMDSAGRRVMTARLAEALRKVLPPEFIKEPKLSPMTISLANPHPYPGGLIDLSGFSAPSPGGAWTVGPIVSMEFSGSYTRPFLLTLNVTHVLAENIKSPLRIRSGGDEKELSIHQPDEYSVLLEPKEPAINLTIELPIVTTLKELGRSEDARELGIELKTITITPAAP